MDDERRDGALTGPATGIDRALQAALAVEPSPEFVAGIRTRIANQPATPAWRRPWLAAAAGLVAAAIVIAIAVAVSRPRETTMPAPVAQTLNPARVGRPATTGPGPVVDARREPAVDARPQPVEGGALPRAHATVVRPAADTPQPAALEPEVLIDPHESKALRRLIAGAREGSLDLSAALQATTPTALELPEIGDVVIAPITIEPLAPAAGAEGVRP